MSSLYIILYAMLPIAELRAAIPLGILNYDMPWYQAMGLSLLGNMIPVFFLLWLLPWLSAFFLSFPNPVGRFLEWRTERLRTAQGDRFKKYGALALIPFVAVPLPITGAWTGCLAAWVFDIPRKQALLFISIGVLIAGVVVTILTVAGIAVVRWF